MNTEQVEKVVWQVWSNTDLTEGRGSEYVSHVCELEATAKRLAKGRYVQGGNCNVTKAKGLFIDRTWYYPSNLIKPTKEDLQEESLLEEERKLRTEREAILSKALSLGLTEEEIQKLK